MSSGSARACAVVIGFFMLLAGVWACGSDATQPDEAAAPGPQIQVRDEQSGFVGVTGTLWTINADGTYRTENFVNEAYTLDREGQLTSEQMRSLNEELSSARLAELPSVVQPEGPVTNPRRLVIETGDERFELVVRGGTGPVKKGEKQAGDAAPEERFFAVAEAVGALVNNDE